MSNTIANLKTRARQKAATIALFCYGIVVGTSTPLLLTRCTSSSGCASCGGFCSLALGILPLVLFITMKTQFRRASQRVLAVVHRMRPADWR